MAAEDAKNRNNWIKGPHDLYPHLPLPPSELFSKPNALKSYASKQLSWLLDPLKLKRGEGHFLGWEYEVDKSSYVFSAAEVAKMPSDTVTLSKFINWQDMKNMSSLSSGNVKALKSETGLTKWFGFCKVLVETIFLAMNLDPVEWFNRNSKNGSKLASKKNPFTETDSEEDFVPFTQKTPPKKKLKTKTFALEELPSTGVILEGPGLEDEDFVDDEEVVNQWRSKLKKYTGKKNENIVTKMAKPKMQRKVIKFSLLIFP